MAPKNSVKKYIENGYYHIYNRGVEKRKIFLDAQDYSVFLSYLKIYLEPKNLKALQDKLSDPQMGWKERDIVLKQIRLNNFFGEINLLAYCLMANHFHLLIKQSSFNSIDFFINSLCTRYVMYFNRKYNRVGPLYQGVYKAVSVGSDEQLLYLSAYIHRNPLDLGKGGTLSTTFLEKMAKQPSSLNEYLGTSNTKWIDTTAILPFFSKSKIRNSYLKFLLGNEIENLNNSLKID